MPRRPPVPGPSPRVPVPEAPQVPTPGSAPRSGLGKKIGPLPAWAWGALIVGMIAFVYIIRKGTKPSTGPTDREVRDEEGNLITPQSIYVPTYPGDRPPAPPPPPSDEVPPEEPRGEPMPVHQDYPPTVRPDSIFEMGGGPPNRPANGIVPSEIFGVQAQFR